MIEGGILFTPSSQMEGGLYRSCVYVLAIDDNLIEVDMTVSVLINVESLSANDASMDPSMVEITVKDNENDGKIYCPYS